MGMPFYLTVHADTKKGGQLGEIAMFLLHIELRHDWIRDLGCIDEILTQSQRWGRLQLVWVYICMFLLIS